VLGQRGVWRRADLSDQGRFGCWSDPPRPPGSGGGDHRAALASPLTPAFDRAEANAEEAGRLGLGQAGVDGAQEPFAEVGRVLLHPDSLTPGQLIRNLL
jgi:hypothetical protein